MKPPTVREIAAAAGCDFSTVSRALSGSSLVAEETRRRILNIAEKMGWKPNPLTSAFAAHWRASHKPSYKATLAVIVDRPIRPGEQGLPPAVERYVEAARTRAEEFGYGMDLHHLQAAGMSLAQVHRVMVHRNTLGVVLHSAAPVKGIQEIDWSRFAVAERRNNGAGLSFHRVAVNAHRGFYQMICKAFALGYRRIGVIASRQYDRALDHGVLFPAAFARERLRKGQSLETLILPSHNASEEPRIQRWLRKHQPEIVIGVDLVWDAIVRMGWRIPEDIAFISVDRSSDYPHTAGFNQRGEIQLSLAVDLVIWQLTTNQRGLPKEAVLQLVNGRWEDGESAPPRGGRS